MGLFNAAPEVEQGFLCRLPELHGPGKWKHHWGSHDDLATRILVDGAPKFILFDHDVAETVRLGGESGGDARRSCSNDDEIELTGLAMTVQPADGFDGLAALFDGIANEAHAPQFARDEQSGDIRLKGCVNLGKFDTALGCSEHQRNGPGGACFRAFAMAYAMGGGNEFRPATDQAQNVTFGTSLRARAASHAERWIDDGMKCRRLCETGLDRRPS